MDDGSLDFIFFVVAILVNLLMVGIFLSRPAGLKRLEFWLGLVLEVLAVPVVLVVILNILAGRNVWFIILPLPLILFLAVELWFDYLLKLDFRHTSLLGPYLLLYYLSLMGLIGYTFLSNKAWGFITLAAYFLNLFATWYSFRKVGHGDKTVS